MFKKRIITGAAILLLISISSSVFCSEIDPEKFEEGYNSETDTNEDFNSSGNVVYEDDEDPPESPERNIVSERISLLDGYKYLNSSTRLYDLFVADLEDDGINEIFGCGEYFNSSLNFWVGFIQSFHYRNGNLEPMGHAEYYSNLSDENDLNPLARIRVDDVDGDSRKEIVACGTVGLEDFRGSDGALVIFEFHQNGSIQVSANYTFDDGQEFSNAVDMDLIDLDSDGNKEILLSCTSGPRDGSSNYHMRIMDFNGTELKQVGRWDVGGYGGSAPLTEKSGCCGDVDGDGDLELVFHVTFGSQFDDDCRVYVADLDEHMNVSRVRESGPMNWGVDTGSQDVLTADLDMDGTDEIYTATTTGGTGNSRFNRWIVTDDSVLYDGYMEIPDTGGAFRVSSYDLDHDGIDDLITNIRRFGGPERTENIFVFNDGNLENYTRFGNESMDFQYISNVKDIDLDGVPDIVAGSTLNDSLHFEIWSFGIETRYPPIDLSIENDDIDIPEIINKSEGEVSFNATINNLGFSGCQQRRIFYSDSNQTWSSLSPDGKLMAYCSENRSDGTRDIWLLNDSDGSIGLIHDSDSISGRPSFDKEGNRVYSSDEENGIFYLDIKQKMIHIMIDRPGQEIIGSVSDNGHIAYLYRPGPFDDYQLMIMNDTTGDSTMVRSGLTMVDLPSINPEGDRIVYSRYTTSGGDKEVFIIERTGNTWKDGYTERIITNDQVDELFPCFLGNENEIIFEIRNFSRSDLCIFSLADGSSSILTTDHLIHSFPSASRSEDKILCSRYDRWRGNMDIWMITSTGRADVVFYDGDPTGDGYEIERRNINCWGDIQEDIELNWDPTEGYHDIFISIENIDPVDSRDANNIASILVRVDIPKNNGSTGEKISDLPPWFGSDMSKPSLNWNSFDFMIEVNDDYWINSTFVEYSINGDGSINASMDMDHDLWSLCCDFDRVPYTIDYKFTAVDSKGKWNTSANYTFHFLDAMTQDLYFDRSSAIGTTGDPFIFEIDVLKNDIIEDVKINIDQERNWVFRMIEGDGFFMYEFDIPAHSIMTLTYSYEFTLVNGYVFHSIEKNITVEDNDAPEIIELEVTTPVVNETRYFEAIVSLKDNIGVDRSIMECWIGPDLISEEMEPLDGSSYHVNITITKNDLVGMDYSLLCFDIFGNRNRSDFVSVDLPASFQLDRSPDPYQEDDDHDNNPLPIIIIGGCIMVIALLGLSLLIIRKNGYRFRGLELLPLSTKLKEDDVQKNVIRIDIIRKLDRYPGITFNVLRKIIIRPNGKRMGRGTLKHHLDVLRNHHLIKILERKGRTLYFPNWYRLSDLDQIDLPWFSSTQYNILRYLRGNPGSSLEDIRKGMGIRSGRENLRYHVKGLVEDGGIIEETRDGKEMVYSISDSFIHLNTGILDDDNVRSFIEDSGKLPLGMIFTNGKR